MPSDKHESRKKRLRDKTENCCNFRLKRHRQPASLVTSLDCVRLAHGGRVQHHPRFQYPNILVKYSKGTLPYCQPFRPPLVRRTTPPVLNTRQTAHRSKVQPSEHPIHSPQQSQNFRNLAKCTVTLGKDNTHACTGSHVGNSAHDIDAGFLKNTAGEEQPLEPSAEHNEQRMPWNGRGSAGSDIRGHLPQLFKRYSLLRRIPPPVSHPVPCGADVVVPRGACIEEKPTSTWEDLLRLCRACGAQGAAPQVQAVQAALHAASNAPVATHLLERLNPQQLRAVLSSSDRPLLVAAGPGSGKTSAMIARVAYLLSQVRSSALLAS
jgi:hypothetical protein